MRGRRLQHPATRGHLVISFALLGLCTLAGGVARGAQPAAVSLSLPAGRLALAPGINPAGSWVRLDDGRLIRSEGSGPFDGGLEVHDAEGVLELRAWRSTFAIGDVIQLRLLQAGDCSLSLTICLSTAGPASAPIPIPAFTLVYREVDLTLLILRHPGLRPHLDALLGAVDARCHWEASEFALAQLNPEAYVPPPGVAARVSSALSALDSTNWRTRGRATAALAESDAALFVTLRVNRTVLSPEQRRGLDEALAGYPVLTDADRRALDGLLQQTVISFTRLPRDTPSLRADEGDTFYQS